MRGSPEVRRRGADSGAKRPPFYPHHYRLASLALLLATVYVSALYAPTMWRWASGQHTEADRLRAAYMDEASLLAWRSRLDAMRARAARSSATSGMGLAPSDPLELIYVSAQVNGVRLLEVRPGERAMRLGVAARPVGIEAEGSYADVLNFAAQLEASADPVTLEALALEASPVRRGTRNGGGSGALGLRARVWMAEPGREGP